jgi:hypothetical protein
VQAATKFSRANSSPARTLFTSILQGWGGFGFHSRVARHGLPASDDRVPFDPDP